MVSQRSWVQVPYRHEFSFSFSGLIFATARVMVFLTNESANKAEIDILSARDTTRPGP